MTNQKKKVVVIAGGNGSATSINALKNNRDVFDISSIVSVSDSGGSSGTLRKEMNVLPPGDLMRAVLAMSSSYDYQLLKNLFYKKRFNSVGKMDNHNLGNMFLSLGSNYTGDIIKPIRALEQSVEAVGHVYPATLQSTDLIAELENGEIIRTEAEIDKPKYDKSIKIKKVYLNNSPTIYQDAKKVIEEADYILFGPGSLYTSVIATILPDGFQEAILNSKAKLIFISGNAYHLNAETGPTSLCKGLWTLEEYLPRKIDKIIFNKSNLTEEKKEYYKKRGWGLLECNLQHIKKTIVITGDYERKDCGLDYNKLGVILKKELV